MNWFFGRILAILFERHTDYRNLVKAHCEGSEMCAHQIAKRNIYIVHAYC